MFQKEIAPHFLEQQSNWLIHRYYVGPYIVLTKDDSESLDHFKQRERCGLQN